MITIEQIQKLDQKVQAVVEQATGLKRENAALKSKLDQYQKRIGELEVMIERFKQDQEQIEKGILRALEQLDRLEDSAVEETPEPVSGADSPGEDEAEDPDSEKNENELDIF